MKLKRLEIHNYKSLRNVVLEPARLSVFVGPNAAGKSNLADALDFLGDVYRWDLENAVKKKGGYENICFRQSARSQAPIRFRLILEVPSDSFLLLFDHVFELKTQSRGIGASFYISAEELVLRYVDADPMLKITRRRGHEIEIEGPQGELKKTLMGSALTSLRGRELLKSVLDTELLLLPLQGLNPVIAFVQFLGSLRIFRLSPRHCRDTGVPTPNAELDRFGSNLPAVIDYLRRNELRVFDRLLGIARRVMPSLESLETGFTHTKTLALFLKESGVKRPWTAEDISDGTIQAIALLAATFDPRIPILVIEEPENSVHPWAIRNFIEAFREASEKKQIFLTTHSPILIDQIRPEELWVVQRPALETKITPVLELDPSLKDSWGQGKFTLSEYLDSGALPEAVPAAGS